MQVITGKFKGRAIKAPAGMNTRPTKQRIRESLFNIIENQLDFKDKVIGDIFAGSGAFALEAISRGARKAYLFEKDRTAIKTILENFRGESNFEIITDALHHSVRDKFDLIYLDPPYGKNLLAPAIALFTDGDLLNDKAIIITETAKEEITEFNGLSKYDTRFYNKIKIDFFHKNPITDKA